MDSVVSIDGNINREKLTELLNSGAEIDALDFKATCDLTKGKAKVDLVKDCAALANLPRGGYIVIGAHEDGRPAVDKDPINGNFDSAALQQMFDGYVSGNAQIRSASHAIEGRALRLIYVQPSTDHLPVVMKKNGMYTEESGSKSTVFYEGQILTRFSSNNSKLEHKHWKLVLSNYEADLRKRVEKDSQALLKVVLDEIRQLADAGTGASTPAPLSTHLDEDSFYLAALSLAVSGVAGVERIRTAMGTLVETGSRGRVVDNDPSEEIDGFAHALDQLSLVAMVAVDCGNPDLFDLVVDAYLEIYRAHLPLHEGKIVDDAKGEAALAIVDILVQMFLLGSYITRRQKWHLLPRMAGREIRLFGGYRYSSWIRHALVQVSRAEVLRADNDGKGKGGNILAVARAYGRERPPLRRDILATVEVETTSEDRLLNSLCQFDLWWCVIADLNSEGEKSGFEFYPNFAVFHGYRTEPAVDIIATDSEARSAVFPGSSEKAVASALSRVLEVAGRESRNQGFHTEVRLSVDAQDFIDRAQT
ncbi:AlbA family DNA-binding domain-containing protein [Rhodococcus sp. 66b]|uniref:AlbA family DNA-binding domain-containing protein n=1 Tax=Rhodococcus sp. 66b TaxID=1945511 RepID=UPI0009BC37B8|nr:hypothetical protein [Rhodococcus sp. 66b]OQM78222.1 hypothetical protein B0E55_05837 [Rhodococcus sp. 66b]